MSRFLRSLVAAALALIPTFGFALGMEAAGKPPGVGLVVLVFGASAVLIGAALERQARPY